MLVFFKKTIFVIYILSIIHESLSNRFVMQQHLIEVLEARVTEVEWFGRQHGLLIEPHLYPKGLFHVQSNSVHCYDLAAYVVELRQDLAQLKRLTLPLIRMKAADKLLQKVNVLINAFRSQNLRVKSKNFVSPFEGEVNLETGNIYEYLATKNQPPSHKRLTGLLEKQQIDKQKLMVSLKEKERQLKKEGSVDESMLLRKSWLIMATDNPAGAKFF